MTLQQKIRRAVSAINNVRAELGKRPGPAQYATITALAHAQANLATAYRELCNAEEKQQHNPNCDGAGPCCLGEVRLLPVGDSPDHGNMILCRNCYGREIDDREARNLESAGHLYDLPNWETLKPYGQD